MAKQTPVVEVNDIVSAGDIAKLLSVSPQNISNWRARGTHNFPQPITVVANGRMPLWRKSQIVFWWAKQHPSLVNALKNMEE
jgi:hypothetical protein